MDELLPASPNQESLEQYLTKICTTTTTRQHEQAATRSAAAYRRASPRPRRIHNPATHTSHPHPTRTMLALAQGLTVMSVEKRPSCANSLPQPLLDISNLSVWYRSVHDGPSQHQ